MTLKDTIESDSLTVFVNTDEFAELVTYYPHRFYGEEARADREIKAVVFREPYQTITEDVETGSPVWVVHVVNSVTTGIGSSELDTGGDRLGFPPRDGKDAESKLITRIITQDHGMLVLECR